MSRAQPVAGVDAPAPNGRSASTATGTRAPTTSAGRTVRVLHVFGSMDRGGAEMRTVELLRRLNGGPYRLHFLTLSGRPGALAAEIRALGGKIHPVPLNLAFPIRLLRLLRRERIDVVHSHVHFTSGYLLKLARWAGVPVRVAHFRNTRDGKDESIPRRGIHRLGRRWIDRHATHVLAVCEGAMASAWSPRWSEDPRCRVVYNGLDVGPFEGPADRAGVRREFGFPPDAPVVVHVGRMQVQKNHERVLSVFAAVHRRAPAFRLLLVGRRRGDREARLRERIAALGLQGAVVIAGEREDVPRILKAADLLLLPSLWEGLPGAVLEACAAGTPVLASDLPGVREIARLQGGVHFLSLDRPDEEWRDVALALAGGGGKDPESRQPPATFSGGAFDIRRCAAVHAGVWNAALGGARR